LNRVPTEHESTAASTCSVSLSFEI
jgi:hypothetical protein